MSNYIVTGAAGFIGHKVCDQLLNEGHTVLGIDNLNDGYDIRLKQWRLNQCQKLKDFEFHKLDICDRDGLAAIFRSRPQFDGLLNLAARAGVRPSVQNPELYYETNTLGTLTLIKLAVEFGIEKFVLASTSSLYGEAGRQAFREDMSTDQPVSPYAASKKAAEALAYTYHHLEGIDVTVFRYFTVFGPAGRPDMSPFRFVQWISEGRPVVVYGDGTQSRDFTYVDDVALGTVLGLRKMGYQIINLGSHLPVSLTDFIHLIEKLTGKTAHLEYQPRHKADVSATFADIGKARELLDWQPHCSLESGLSNLVDWYQENRAWAKLVQTL